MKKNFEKGYKNRDEYFIFFLNFCVAKNIILSP